MSAAGARRVPGTQAGAEAVPPARVRYARALTSSLTSPPSRPCPGFRGARPHPARTPPWRFRHRCAHRLRRRGRRHRAAARSGRGTVGSRGGRRSRGALSDGGARVRRRPGAVGQAAHRPARRAARLAGRTRVRRGADGAHAARARNVPDDDRLCATRRSPRSAAIDRSGRRQCGRVERSCEPATLRVHDGSAAGQRKPPATSVSSRRRAKDARRSKSSRVPRRSARAACRSTRWRSFLRSPRTVSRACSSTRARAAACRPSSIAARGGPTRPAARSSRCCRARSRASRRSGSTSTCRSARCRGRRPAQSSTSADAGLAGAARRCVRRTIRRRRRPIARMRTVWRRPADVPAPIPTTTRSSPGTLRAPWKWEELIVESAVIGGRRARRQGRWHRRLDGLAADYRIRIAGAAARGARVAAHRAARARPAQSRHLRAFALPIIDALALARRGDVGRVARSVRRARAARAAAARRGCCASLAELRPMAAIGPVSLEEARDVAARSAADARREPPAHRYGRVFVGTPHQARGRAFRVVFVPGPGRTDVSAAAARGPAAARRAARAARRGARRPGRSRQHRASAAAARRRRGDASGCGCRIRGSTSPSRARACRRSTRSTSCARSPDGFPIIASCASGGRRAAARAWPGRRRRDPVDAIDDLEHDLSVLQAAARLARPGDGEGPRALPASAERRAAALGDQPMGARPSRVDAGDGLIRVARHDQADARRAAAAARGRTRCRRCSGSRRVRTSSCSRRSTGSSRRRSRSRSSRLDPLTRGSLFHEVQAEFFRAMQARRRAAGRRATLARRARDARRASSTAVAAEYAERLAPAIDRVWRDEIAEHAPRPRHLGAEAAGRADWRPDVLRVQLRADRRGARSAEPARIRSLVDGRFVLRGSVDLIEHRAGSDVLRITDHKTGKNRSTPELIVGGGACCSRCSTASRSNRASASRCVAGACSTARRPAASSSTRSRSTTTPRGRASQALEIIDRAIELGFLPAAPSERACTWCDFRPVCGPREEERVQAQGRGQAGRSRRAEERCDDARRPTTPTPRRRDRDALDDTLVVEAAAGTGKTTELVNRDPARARDRPRDDAADRRGDVHRKSRRRAEAAAARGARAGARAADAGSPCAIGSRTRSRRSRKRTSTRSTASARSCCASVRSKRASIRCSRCSPSRRRTGCTRARSAPWLQDALTRSARRASPRAAPDERPVRRRRRRADRSPARRRARRSPSGATFRSRGSGRRSTARARDRSPRRGAAPPRRRSPRAASSTRDNLYRRHRRRASR